jgi:PAS domain S-box-containing protein
MGSNSTRRQGEAIKERPRLPGDHPPENAEFPERLDDATLLQRAEQALRDSEERFRVLFETMAQGVVYQNASGAITSANPAAEAILGLSLDQMQGRTSVDPRWRAVREDGTDFPGEEHPAMVALRTGKAVHGVVMGVYHPQSADYRWLLIDAIPQFAAGDTQPSSVYATFNDITARKRMELELADSHTRLKLALDAARAGVWEWNFHRHEAIWSEKNYELLGLALGQGTASDDAWLQAVHPDDRTAAMAAIADAVNNYKQLNFDFRVVWPDGTVHWLNDRAQLLVDAQGQPERMVGIKVDITERQHAADALQDQVNFLQSLLAAFPNPVFYKDRAGRYIGCNQAFCEFIGRPQAEIVGRTVEDIYAPDLAAIYRQADEQVMARDFRQEYEAQIDHADGRRRDVLFRKAVFRDHSGAVAGLLGFLLDITDRKQTEAQLRQAQKMEAIGVLAGGIAHDFNNLLTPIVGYAEMMLEDAALDARQQRYLTNILTAGQRAKRLVRQLLTFSQPQPSEKGLVDLRQAVGEALLLLRPAVPSMIEIRTAFDPDCRMVLAEPTQILQIIMNLATNAFQAIGEEQGLIRIGVHHQASPPHQSGAAADGKNWVRLEVHDTGIGMDDATRQRVFEPFFTTKAVGKGTGLGLPVVYGIVQHLGGQIEVASEPGKGSTFVVMLPAAAKAEGHEAVEPVLASPRAAEG